MFGDPKVYSETEAAVLICASVVIADRVVHPSEVEEFVSQVQGLISLIDPRFLDDESNTKRLTALLNTFEQDYSGSIKGFQMSQIADFAKLIEDRSLKLRLMKAIIDISFADDLYHDAEKEIVKYLREEWDV